MAPRRHTAAAQPGGSAPDRLTVLAVRIISSAPAWLVSDGDPQIVRVVESGYAGGQLYVTAPLHGDGLTWEQAGGTVTHPLPRFAEPLRGGMWQPGDDGAYRRKERVSDEPETVYEPDVCADCGSVSGPPSRWVLAPSWCDICSRWGQF